MKSVFDMIDKVKNSIKRSNPLTPKVNAMIKYVGSKKRFIKFKSGGRANDISGDIYIVQGNFKRDKKQWVEMKDFSDKQHYKGKDNRQKVDLNNSHSEKYLWFGPNARFRVNSITAPAPWHGSRINISILDKQGDEVCKVLFVHCCDINSIMFEEDRIFKPGTYIGRTNRKIGVSTGPHLHITILTLGLKRNDLYKIMKGEES